LFIPVAGIENFLDPLRRKPASARIAEAEQPARKPAPAKAAAQPEELPASAMFVMPTLETAPNKKEAKAEVIATQEVSSKAAPAPAVAVSLSAAVAETKSNFAAARGAGRAEIPDCVPAHNATDSYVVQPGDTLSQLARRFNMKLKDLIELNGIKDPNRIPAGTTLKLVR
jgi:LysM repeat protein